MALMQWIRSLWDGKVRVSLASVLRLGTAVWSKRDLITFAKEGYAANVIVFRCVDIIAKSLASIPLIVKQGDEIVGFDHPLVKLLARPNPRTTKARLVHHLVAFRLIAGNGWLEKIGPGDSMTNPPRELWVWPPYNMRPVVSKQTMIPVGYAFDDGMQKVGWEVDQLTGRSCMLQWMTFNPLNPWIGMSPIESMARSVDQRNAADEWNQALLQNSAEPSGIFTSESEISQPQMKQLRQQLDEKYSGPRNAKRPMILGGGGKWTQTALSPKDMDWLNGKNIASRDIAGAFGVPTQVIPIQGDQTFANYEQARLALWEDTVIPLGLDLVEELNHWFLEDFPGAVISMDLDNIPALAPRRAAKWETAQKSTFISTNEKRDLVDRPAVEEKQGDGDQILVAGSNVTLEEVTGELPDVEPRTPPTTAGRRKPTVKKVTLTGDRFSGDQVRKLLIEAGIEVELNGKP